jgi:uncharacterized protein (TIGR02145 family)
MKQIIFLTILFAFLAAAGCKKDNGVLSTVETYSPKYIASKSAIIGCRVKSDGGSGIVSCGVYISLSANAETSGVALLIGNDTGLYKGQVTGLAPATQYFVKAYAKNAKGESLGAEVNFTTPATVKDYDNNEYQTVKIQDQTWMEENLKTAHYNNGDPVSTTTPATLDISAEVSPKYSWSYGGNDANAAVYGKLYTWYATTDTRNLCPAGWHIPTDVEWTALENILGGYSTAGSILKEYANGHWISPYNEDATNESCFTALPGGIRAAGGSFSLLQNKAVFWSASESDASGAWIRSLEAASAAVGRTGFAKNSGASVRCKKD